MMSGLLALYPEIANSGSISESPLRPHSQPLGSQQAPRLEVDEQPQEGTTIGAERYLDLAP